MAYSIFTPTGSEHAAVPLSVPDNAIDLGLYNASNKLGVQLVGRNAIDYGTAIAQNTIQMISNFAGGLPPVASKSLQGQLWFNATSATGGSLYVRIATTTGGEFPAGWSRILLAYSGGTPQDGDIRTTGSGSTFKIEIWGNGAWNQVFPSIARYS
jgi:hypothetical protein